MSLDTAYNKLAAKWQGYFERSRNNGDHGDSNATPLPGKGQRRSLFQMHQTPSRPQARSATLPSERDTCCEESQDPGLP